MPLPLRAHLHSARSLSDRLEKQRLLRSLFSWVPVPEQAFERAQRTG
ncbi:hypothetical protein [Streptomyces sp. TR06-5]